MNGTLSQNEVYAVSGNFYSELGATPLFGRLLTPEGADPHSGSTQQVAVLSYEFWRCRFGGVPGAIGKQISIEGTPALYMLGGITSGLRSLVERELAATLRRPRSFAPAPIPVHAAE